MIIIRFKEIEKKIKIFLSLYIQRILIYLKRMINILPVIKHKIFAKNLFLN